MTIPQCRTVRAELRAVVDSGRELGIVGEGVFQCGRCLCAFSCSWHDGHGGVVREQGERRNCTNIRAPAVIELG